MVGVAASVTRDESGRARNLRIGVTGTSTIARRARAMERALEGAVLARDVVEAASEQASEGIDFNDDLLLSAEDRAHLCRATAREAVLTAWSQTVRQEVAA